ncbi:hypothetical protein [Kangiella marina]|uniref:Nuclear transport factor 2 family protein n=1 Tax=Kangiella marina TaxID=1079178 RepID=A0ABP8IKK3_9GAMM
MVKLLGFTLLLAVSITSLEAAEKNVPIEVVDQQFKTLIIESLKNNNIDHDVYGDHIWIKNSDLNAFDKISSDIEHEYAPPSERTVSIHSIYLQRFKERLQESDIKYTIVEWNGSNNIVLENKEDISEVRVIKFEVMNETRSNLREDLEKKSLPIFR